MDRCVFAGERWWQCTVCDALTDVRTRCIERCTKGVIRGFFKKLPHFFLSLYLLRTSKANYITFLYSHIQPSCNLFICYSSVSTNQFQGTFFIPLGRGCSWTSGALCNRHTRAAIFEHFNPLIDDSTRKNFIPMLSTYVEMNLCSRHTFCPQKAYDRTLFLLGAIYKFCSYLHHGVTTLILNCKISRLVRLTSYVTLSDTTKYYFSCPHRFLRKYKSAETF